MDPMGDQNQSKARLEALTAQLKKAQQERQAKEPQQRQGDGGMGQGLRMGIELVAATLVGAFLGWLLDRWLNTSPWLLILFFLLGVAAGFRNINRITAQMTENAEHIDQKDK